MNEPANYWKLGLFVVLGALLMATGVVYLATSSLRKESVSYTSYFDESITGLDVGSPVRFRGVNVGKVSTIDIAPDRRQVQITYELGISVLSDLGLAAAHGQNTKLSVPADLRAQIGSAGMTGVKYVLIDFFDVESNPRPKLPFPPSRNYIPSAPSTMKNLEDSVMRAIEEFPVITKQLSAILQHLDSILADVDGEHFSDMASTTFGNLDRALANWDQTLVVVRKTLGGMDTAGISSDARASLTQLTATMTRAQELMARVDGDNGVLSSVQRASDSIGDVAVDARSYQADLSDTLREVGDAANAIRALADTLELDSDMLLKGRSKAIDR